MAAKAITPDWMIPRRLYTEFSERWRVGKTYKEISLSRKKDRSGKRQAPWICLVAIDPDPKRPDLRATIGFAVCTKITRTKYKFRVWVEPPEELIEKGKHLERTSQGLMTVEYVIPTGHKKEDGVLKIHDNASNDLTKKILQRFAQLSMPSALH